MLSHQNNQNNQNTSRNAQPDRYRHPCPHCQLRFTCPHNVTQHCREKHEELGYPKLRCTYPGCSSSFGRDWGLNRHMKSVHGIDQHHGRGNSGDIDLDVDPEGGKKKRKRTGGKKGVGRRGPIRVLPLEETPKPWTIRIIEGEPQILDPGVAFDYDFQTDGGVKHIFEPPFDYDFNAGDGAEQMFESPFDYETPAAAFQLQDINCLICGITFDDCENLLGHLHLSHDFPYSESCDCMVCSAMKLSGQPFHWDHPLAQPPGQAQAQAGAAETERHDSVCGGTAMEIENNASSRDSSKQTSADQESPAEGVQPVKGSTYLHADDIDSSTVEVGFIGADHDQDYFEYLNPQFSALLRKIGAALEAQRDAVTGDPDEAMYDF